MLNVEKLVVDHLNTDGTLGDYPASLSIPPDRPGKFITVERTGGGENGHVSTVLLAVQVWDSSRWNASDAANRLVEPSLHRLIDHDEIGAVNIESNYNDPDPLSGQARYQIVVQLHCMADD